MDKRELLQAMREGHQRVAVAIKNVPDRRLVEPGPDGWSGKDLLTHIAWWHDHSARVTDALRAGRQPYDRDDAANSTDAINERILRDHREDPPQVARREFDESFARLMAALEPLDDDELFASDRWPWLDGEALVEMVLWDSSRHYDAHREQLERAAERTSPPRAEA